MFFVVFLQPCGAPKNPMTSGIFRGGFQGLKTPETLVWWAVRESNTAPIDYESTALTKHELTALKLTKIYYKYTLMSPLL